MPRRQFLKAVASGAACISLGSIAVGCELVARPGLYEWPAATHSFRSRPDLRPPAVDVLTRAPDRGSGYIFVAPKGVAGGQGGPMILDDSGQLVWFRPAPEGAAHATDFKVASYQGRAVLTFQENESAVVLDDSYREIARVQPGNGYDEDHHEFLIGPRDTALLTLYSRVRWDLSPLGGPKAGILWEGVAQELDIQSGEVLFEWRSSEHVGLDESHATLSTDRRQGVDYFHINSIDVDHDNNLLISARDTSTVYKIDRTSGEVIWRLGGKKSDFEMGPGARFAYQHDVRRQPDGTITVFDNSTTVFENGIPRAVEESRGIVLDLDEQKMRATLVREYTHPDKQFADAAGNMQVLPNGNVFIGWGRALTFSEFSEDGDLLYSARFPRGFRSDSGSYRAFRFPWSAHPSEQPAVVADHASKGTIRVYASWNGATEVATWQVLAGPDPERLKPVGEVAREGFETAITVRTAERHVAARARDRSGRVLGTSDVITL